MAEPRVKAVDPADEEEAFVFPASFAQERLWLLANLAPESSAYNCHRFLRVTGTLQLGALQEALRLLVHRHETLRTSFGTSEGRTVQIVHPSSPWALRVVDLSRLDPAEREREASRLARCEVGRRFDLRQIPLLRIHAVRLGSEETLLLFCQHHIVTDGWSMGILVHEVSVLYEALARGLPVSLPDLPIQYADYAVWQRERFAGPAAARDLDYWRRYLRGVPQVLDLPLDHPRRPGEEGSLEPARPSRPVSEVGSRGFLGMVQSQQATPFMGLLAAFQAVTSRWTGEDDFLIGTPVSGRGLVETEGLIGFFVNMLVLRSRISRDLCFRQLLAAVRTDVLEAFARQEAPFTKVVEAVRTERVHGNDNLFQLLFTLRQEQDRDLNVQFSGAAATPLGTRANAAKFDLSLTIVAGQPLSFVLDYRSDLFERATMVRLADRLVAFLDAVSADPEAPLAALDLLSEAERHQLLVEWNDVEQDFPRTLAIHEVFAAQARRRPDAVAVVWRDQTLTYGELDRRSRRLGHWLRGLGVAAETPVAVFLERSPDLVVGLLGILAAGGFYVPLEPAYPELRLAAMLKDSGATVIITERRLAVRLDDAGAAVVCLDELPAFAADEPAPELPTSVGAEATAYALYTSGSTGQPKGVRVPHRGVVRLVKQDRFARLDAGEVFLQAAPISFDASTLEIWGPLLTGGRLVLYEESELSLDGLERAIRANGVTLLWLTAGLFHQMVEERGEALAGVRQLLAGGDVLQPAWVEKLFRECPGVQLVNGYGPTENTTFTCCHAVLALPPEGHTLPIGRPIANTWVHVLDPALQPVPIGAFGELCVAGDGLASGYLSQPSLTAERFVPSPFALRSGERLYRSGDRVRHLPDGTIEFAGRLDQQVKVRGYRVEPGEVEAVLSRHPAVREAAVVVREERPGDKRLVAFAAGPGDAAADVEAWLARTLPVYMLPSALVWLEELPKNANGKLDRQALLTFRAYAEAPEPEEGSEVLTATEEVMAEIWAEVLGLERVDRRASFFDLGGHSLQAMQVISRVRKVFSVELPMRALFENDTLCALAAGVEQTRRSELGIHLPPIERSPREEMIPLSFAQQRLWFLNELIPGSSAYNIPAAWFLSGGLRFKPLAASMTEVVRRHEALRTTFQLSGNGPAQSIAPAVASLPLPMVDLRGLRPEDREPEARRLAQAEALRPFDLKRGPLLRVAVVRLEEEETLVLANMHHIVSDGWSIGILGREIAALEEAFASGRPSPLPELAIQYADFAVWQRKALAGGAVEAEIQYWQEQLRDAPPVADLPLDRPRAATRSDAGASRSLRLSRELTGALKLLGRRQGATLFMSLLAGLQALLARYARKPDVSVGTPVAGRNHVEVEGLIGFFVNTLVLRARLGDDPSFHELLQRVRSTTLDAHTHQAVPFEELVEALKPERSVAFSPLFQVMFTVQGNAGWGRGLRGLRARTAEVESRTAKFDLTLSVADLAEGLDLSLGYSTDLFDATTAVRLLGHLETLLAAAVAELERRISELPFLSEPERANLREWNDTLRPYPRERCVHELFAEQARLAPHREALVWRGERVSYGELDRRANRLAHHLRSLGVGPETRVGTVLKRSPEMIVGILGILKAGAAYVPLDPSYPDERLAFLVSDAELAVVLADEEAPAAVTANAATVVYLDREREGLAAAPVVSVAPENLAYVLYTSGSTGWPKGVEVVHRNVVRLVHEANFMRLGPEESFLQLAPVSFDAATLEIWGPLLHGGRLVLYPEAHASIGDLGEILTAEEVSSLWLTAGLFHKVVEEGSASLGRLRQLLAGGDVLSPRHVRKFLEENRGVTLTNGYGPTENTTFTCCWKVTDAARVDGSVPIGRPITNTVVHILDANLRPLPIGVGGELYAGGDGVARGYLNEAALTAARFVPSPYGEPGERLYRTGDLARHLADGTIEFLGRTDDQIKVRGFRIEPGEIEAALAGYPLVRDAVVIAREGSPGDRRLLAYVVPETGAELTPTELRGFLQELLPEYMIPAVFVVLPELPLTSNGKVDRRALPEPERDRTVSSARFVAPRTPVEELLALIWSELLQVARVGIQDNFFELGGHSLLATQVVSRLRSTLRVEIPVRAVFERPVLSDLAYVVEAARRSHGGVQRPLLGQADRGGDLPLSFAQQRLWFIDQLDPGNPVYNVPLGMRLRGALSMPALERSLTEVVRRHEVLRTSYASIEGRPIQVIAEAQSVPLPLVDLEGLPLACREAELRRLARWEAGRPFDLLRGPVLRALLLRAGRGDQGLLTTIHHIACDAWSMEILWSEVTALYAAFLHGPASPLPPLDLQYADFAAWQRRWLEGEVLEAQVDYWKRRLGGDPPTLELPTDRPRPAVQSFRGKLLPLAASSRSSASLQTLVRSASATPFMILLAVFQVLLRRYSGQTDISVGTPITGRNRSELEGLIGFFLNTLVIRLDLPAGVSFLDLLHQVRGLTLEAYAHQDLPFEKLVDELRPKRSLSHSPLFQVMFVLVHETTRERREAGLEITSLSPELETARFDLTLATSVGAEGLSGWIEYNLDLFDAPTIQRMSEHLSNLLEAIGAHPDSAVAALPLLSPAERQQLLVEWNDCDRRLPSGRGIHELFERQTERTPDAPAVTFGDQRLSYAELNRRANQVARVLRDLGAGPEMRVALGIERSLELAIALLGILKAGAAYVPIDPSYPRERRSLMLEQARVSILVTQDSLCGELMEEGLQALCLDSGREAISARSGEDLESGVLAANLAYVMFTSGSTGRPKGVALPHAALRNLIEWHLATLVTGARTLQFASLSFDISFYEMFVCWGSGGTLALVSEPLRRDLVRLADFLVTERIEKAILPVVVLHQLAEEYARRDVLPPLVEITTSGEQLQTSRAMANLFRLLPGCAFHNHYGPSESHVATAYTLDADPERWASHPPIGTPIFNTRVHLLDQDLAPVPVGVPGELYIGGAGLARGYLDQPDRTAERFLPDPFSAAAGERLYRTGDKVRSLVDGNFEFLGRFDHQVKVRGFRVELEEIESALAQHVAVCQSVVLVREDVPGDRRLVAYLVLEGAESPVPWRAFLLERLPDYMVPLHFVVLDALPLTPNGKVDRRALPVPEVSQELLPAAYVVPRTPVQEVLASIWAEVLGVEQTGIADNFFELGGHSLLAMKVVSRVRTAFQIELPLRELFEEPTVAGLAKSVEKLMWAGPRRLPAPLEPVPRAADLPQSFAQQRLWLIDQLEPGNPVYNMPLGVRLRGDLHVPALERALGEVVRRHEVLRTTYASVAGRAVQVIAGRPGAGLPVVDLEDLDGATGESELRRLARREAARPFDLGNGPVLRALLLRLSGGEHALLLTLHHIACDAWSLEILWREVTALYRAFRHGQPSPLAPLQLQYADYAVWQRRCLEGEGLDAQLSYWQERLGGNPPALDLPTDRPLPAVQTFRGRSQPLPLSGAGLASLRTLSRRESATPFMILFSVLQVLLRRYCGQTDISVGTPISGRNRSELEGLIGFFLNTLVIRVDLPADVSFLDLLRLVRTLTLEAYANQDLPFEKLIDELSPQRSLSHSPLFRVMFVLLHEPAAAPLEPGLEAVLFGPEAETAKFELTWSTLVGANGISGAIEYNVDLFDKTTIQRMGEHLRTLLEAIGEHPEAALSALDLLGGAERHQLLTEWNAAAVEYPREDAIPSIFAVEAARHPDRVAVVWRDRSLSFGELDRLSGRLAGRLRRLGVGPEVPVAFCLERSFQAVVAMLGILKAGGFYVPLDPSYPRRRLAEMLEDSGAPVIVTEERLAGVLPETGATQTFLDGSWSGLEEEKEEAVLTPAAVTDAGGTAYVMYTSGSTGRPKGVRVPHRAVVRLVRQDAYAALGEAEVFLQAAPLSFDAATLEVWAPLLNGGRLVLYGEDDLSVAGLERAIRHHGVTTLWLTAGLFHQVVEDRVEALSGLRQLLAGGDVLLPAPVARLLWELPGVRLINGYGPTENTTFSCCHRVVAPPPPGGTVPIGRPIANTQVYVLDRWLQPAPAGTFGELHVGGDGLATGYFGQAAQTAEKFVPHPYAAWPGERLYRTGDLVRWQAGGTMEFAGRIDSQVKLRGYRVELGEVEALLSRHEAVREAAVVVREDRPGDRRLVGFVVPAATAGELPEGLLDELLADLRRALPAHAVPSRLIPRDELPKSPNGKVDRRSLAAGAEDLLRPAAEGPEVPLTAAEAVMAEVWAEVLGREKVPAQVSFFDLGGHSLLAMQVISRIRKVFAVELPMRALFENDTVSALAAHVDQIRRAEMGIQLPAITPVRRTGAIPLSFAQQRLWFLDQLLPGSSAYNVPVAWHLSGRLPFAALAAALTEILRRHEALRTTFHPSDGGAFQVIAPAAAPVAIRVADLRGLAAADRDTEVRRLMAGEAARPFDLARGPLLRLALLRLDSEQSVALLTLHHIVSDGWSLAVLGREISVLEEAFAGGRPSPLPELPVQYADFAVWQRRVMSEGALAAEIGYWRAQLAGAPPVTELPLDRPRLMDWADDGQVRASRLPAGLSAALKALSRSQGATLFMTLLAGFQALLVRYGAEPDVSVGTPVAGRTHLEIEGLIGFFVNTLVLRTRMADDPPFVDLVQRVRDLTLEAHAHQDVPFEELVEKLQPERSLGISPLFQVMFAVQNNAGWGRGLSGLVARTAEIEHRTVKLDLSLGVQEAERGLELALEYSTRLFDTTTAIRLLEALERLLATAAADPSLPLSQLTVLSPAERQHLAVEWNDTAQPAGRTAALHEQIAAQARRTPEALAVIQEGDALSYGELAARAERLARHLRRLEVGSETVVALCVERSLEMVVGILGVLAAGGAYLPLDPSYPQERLALLLFDAPVKVVLTQEHLTSRLPWGDWPVLCLDQPLPEAGPAAACEDLPAAWPEQAAYLIYTSGSTGKPKAVVGVHGSLANYTRAAVQAYGLTSRDRVLQFSSISFDASLEEIFPTLAVGATLVLRTEEWMASAARFLALCEREGVTLLSQPTAHWNELARACGDGEAGVPKAMRLVTFGGERALPERVAQWIHAKDPRSELLNTYGPTESTIVSTGCRLDAPAWSAEPVPIGRPWGGVQVHVVAWDLDLMPPGAAGELVIGGHGVTRGYLDRPALTAERFVPDPFSTRPGCRLYRTGDRVRWLPDGRLDFLGRIDHQVKVRGYRIELGEIEAALAEYPLVSDAVVLAREDVPGTPRLVAYVVPQAGSLPTAVELRGFLEEVLPEFMVPAAFVLLDDLPLTVTGKVDRRALPAPEVSRAASSAPFLAPRTPVEEVLALVWAELLRVDWISVHDNFFELGGHSLLATRLVSQVRSLLDVEVPVRTVFERPTLGGLAHVIESARRSRGGLQSIPLVRVDRTGDLPLSFAQQRLWFIDQLEPGNPVYNVPMAVRLRGDLKTPLLERSLAEVVRRHEVLRTSYPAIEGRPVQAVAAAADIGLPLVDLEGLEEPVRNSELRRLTRWEAGRPFDLAQGPVFRVLLLRLSSGDHALLATIHHIACDAWSTETLWREMALLYAAFRQGRPSPLAPLELQYADYAAWQRQWLDGETLETQLVYWRRRLAGDPPALELPADRPRPAVQTFRGAHQTLALSGAGLTSLRALARREGVTPFMALLAVFQVLLRRYTGQTDISVGTPITGRNRSEVEGLIGFFLNTLVIRVDLPEDGSFLDLLRRVRALTLEAYAHQDLPFEKLVDELRPQRSLSHSPLFQVMFVLVHEPPGEQLEPGLEALPFNPEMGSAKFDLTWSTTLRAGGVSGAIEYSVDLFDKTTIQRLCEHLCNLVEAIGLQPESALSSLALLSAAEGQQLLVEWNDTGMPLSGGGGVHELFERQAERTPDLPAVAFAGRQLSYDELDRRANQLARALRESGAGPEARVGLCVERSLEMAAGLLGILKAGAAYVPLDPAYPRERRRLMLQDAQVTALVTQESLRDELWQEGMAVLCLDGDRQAGDRWSGEGIDSGVRAANLAYVIFTSGSTGRPKGVALPHAALRNLIDWHLGELATAARTLQFSSLSFDASFHEMFVCWASGGTLVVPAEELRRDASALASFLVTERIEKAILPVVMLHQLAEEYGRRQALPPLAEIIATGEQLQTTRALAQLLRRLPGCTFHNHYGPSESHVATAFTLSAEPDLWGSHPAIGLPIANTRIHLLDPELAPVPAGVPGELYIGGVCLARGYLGRADRTAERFVPDPLGGEPGARLYRTGDKVRRLVDGNLDFIGRFDHQVKIRGFRVELEEIEAVLAQHPAVRQCVVMAQEGMAGDRRLVAYLVADSGDGPAGWRAFLRERLPEYMVPSQFIALDTLPLTPNGKVDRRRLLDLSLEMAAEDRTAVARTPVEEIVAGIWSELLGGAQVGLEDNFFELGGHSLTATRVISRVGAVLAVELPVRALFESPTLAGFAAAVEARRDGEGGPRSLPPIGRVPRDGRAIPASLGQERIWSIQQRTPESVSYNMPFALRLTGRLSPAALAASLAEVVRRHEALRTTFGPDPLRPEEVCQWIAPPGPFPVPLIDLGGLPGPADALAEARRLAAWDAARPFDLQCGSLLRCALFRLGEESHMVLLVMHHIISDGWSLGVLVQELSEIYGACLAGRAPRLPELPVQYADFAVWQREQLSGERVERLLAYWQERMAGAPPSLKLPTDRPRPAVPASRGTVLTSALPAEAADRVRALCRSEGTTLFMTLLAAFAAVLGRWSGQSTVVVGAPVSGRNRAETEGLIGFFINVLALRVDLGGVPSGRQLLQRTREATLGAYAHQDLPLSVLASALQAGQDLPPKPLFQVMLVLQNTPAAQLDLPGLRLQQDDVPSDVAKYELTVAMAETGRELAGSWELNLDLFDPSTVRRMAGHMARLLEGMALHPEAPVGELPLLGADERHQLLFEWSEAAGAYVLDPWLQPAPAGSFGELYVDRDGLAAGGPGQAAQAADRFVPHPFATRPGERLYRTGDRARWLAGGTLEMLAGERTQP